MLNHYVNLSGLNKIKLKIFCQGIKIDKKYRHEIVDNDQYANKRASLGSGRFFLLNDIVVVNAPVIESFALNSSLFLTKDNGDWLLLENKEKLVKCSKYSACPSKS